MTSQKAIKILNHLLDDVVDSKDYVACFNIAISAIEKQIPKKPAKTGGLEEDIKIGSAIFKKGTSVLSKCPDCEGWLRPMQKYCSDCGKFIDWSDEE